MRKQKEQSEQYSKPKTSIPSWLSIPGKPGVGMH